MIGGGSANCRSPESLIVSLSTDGCNWRVTTPAASPLTPKGANRVTSASLDLQSYVRVQFCVCNKQSTNTASSPVVSFFSMQGVVSNLRLKSVRWKKLILRDRVKKLIPINSFCSTSEMAGVTLVPETLACLSDPLGVDSLGWVEGFGDGDVGEGGKGRGRRLYFCVDFTIALSLNCSLVLNWSIFKNVHYCKEWVLLQISA